PWIIIGREGHRSSAQAGRLLRLLGFLVRGFGDAALVENSFLARLGTGLPPHPAEERGEAVVVVLAPFLVGMMMTLRALQPLAEQQLGGVLHLAGGIVHLAIPSHRRVLADVAGCGQNLAHELIERFVDQQAVTNPGMERIRAVSLIAVIALVAE